MVGKKVNFNTQKQNLAKLVFEKDCFSLINDCFYGKTTENGNC